MMTWAKTSMSCDLCVNDSLICKMVPQGQTQRIMFGGQTPDALSGWGSTITGMENGNEAEVKVKKVRR